MPLELLTLNNLHEFKNDLLQEIKKALLLKENALHQNLLRSPAALEYANKNIKHAGELMNETAEVATSGVETAAISLELSREA